MLGRVAGNTPIKQGR